MEPTTKSFKQRAAECTNENDVDELCIEWLKQISTDHGDDGHRARELLDTTARLLRI